MDRDSCTTGLRNARAILFKDVDNKLVQTSVRQLVTDRIRRFRIDELVSLLQFNNRLIKEILL